MAEKKKETKKKSNTWIWIVIAIAVVLILFIALKNYNVNDGEAADDISGLDIGENPDLGVDDINSLQVSQEDIIP